MHYVTSPALTLSCGLQKPWLPLTANDKTLDMTHSAPVQVATSNLFSLHGRTILGMSRTQAYGRVPLLTASVSGGAGAVGTVVGKAILESGGDVVFLDMLPQVPEEEWRAF